MAELCPEHLEALNVADEDHSKSSQSKPKEISNILVWVQAFCIYMHSQKLRPATSRSKSPGVS